MGVAIRTAGQGDRERVVRLLDEAFQDDPVSTWVFPDAAHRRAAHPRLMAAFTDIVLAEGRVDLTEDGSACALWLSIPAGDADGGDTDGDDGTDDTDADDGTDDTDADDGTDDTDADDGPARLRDAVDPGNERVELIGRLTAGVHPADRAHAYLWMIGVAPDRQGEGLGTALMAPVLGRCDRAGLPAYLEASSARSRALYARLGFTVTGTPLQLPYGGPQMWPMWREPHA
ncbi:GNAT family N-acetyltransferase [Streptomyces sp. NPDC087212]|uniref:GNAT family N-acetyltransferase n=1 Tax=Streptomyces sp. NPDC087212 TaxID=3365766 RepID=UPI003816FE68